jgi:hypothetical protein
MKGVREMHRLLFKNEKCTESDVVFSLIGKVPHCECGEESADALIGMPAAASAFETPRQPMRLGVKVTWAASFLSER